MRTAAEQGRHRLGMPGLVHCIHHPEVAAALGRLRRGWLWALLSPALYPVKHSLAGLRRRAVAAQQVWSPTPA